MRFKWLVGVLLCWVTPLVVADYSSHPAAATFVQKMVEKHGFDQSYVESVLADAEYQQRIIDLMQRAPERVQTWGEYRKARLTDWRINKGVEFYKTHQPALQRAEQAYGVDPIIVVAILGVETNYGGYMGNIRVLDALSTLGFDYPERAKYFMGELEEYLLMVREQGFDAGALKGSYAGAMGYGQFMPRSYRNYAVDFDSDNVADIIGNPTDAIGSIANYFKRHGWRRGEAVVTAGRSDKTLNRELLSRSARKMKFLPSATVLRAGVTADNSEGLPEEIAPFALNGLEGEELWLAHHNLKVITRYNYSFKYAMLVYQLSEEIRERL